MSEKKLIILRGISGSGKSTLAKKLAEHGGEKVAICSADHYFTDENGEYNFDISKIGEAHNVCFTKAMSSMICKAELIIIDNTNTTRAEFTPYVMLGRSFGYDVELHAIVDFNDGANLDICFHRNEHEVPWKSLKAQAARWEDPKKWVDPRQVEHEFVGPLDWKWKNPEA